MTKLHTAAALGFFALAASTTLAFALSPPGDHGPAFTPVATHGTIALDCRVKDADFWIMNFGSKAIDSGRQVAWRSPRTGDSGVLSLPLQLQPGEEFRLGGVLTSDALAGSPCKASLI